MLKVTRMTRCVRSWASACRSHCSGRLDFFLGGRLPPPPPPLLLLLGLSPSSLPSHRSLTDRLQRGLCWAGCKDGSLDLLGDKCLLPAWHRCCCLCAIAAAVLTGAD